MSRNGPLIGVISDDLTGAGGVATRLAARGVRTRVVWDLDVDWADMEAVVADTRGRDNPDGARARAHSWGRAFREVGVSHASIRVDTTLRGQPAVELDGFLEGLAVDDPILVAMPAHPAAGRVTLEGVQRIQDSIGAVEEVKAAPRLFGDRSVTVVHHSLVRAGPDTIATEITTRITSGQSAFLVDCLSEDDFVTVAAALDLLEMPAERLVTISAGALLSWHPTRLRRGPVIVVVASPTDINRVQLAELRAAYPGAPVIDPHQTTPSPANIGDYPEVVVIETITGEGDGWSVDRASDAVRRTLDILAKTGSCPG